MPFLIHNAFIMCFIASARILKVSNFRILESNVEMLECFNALKLAAYWCVFFCLFFLHVVVLFIPKMLVVCKRKYTHKTFCEKCQALQDLEKRESNKNVKANIMYLRTPYRLGLRKKAFWCTKKEANVKRQKWKSENHELVDQAIYNWFLNMRSQNVPLSPSMIQEKAVIFAKEFNIESLQASDGLLQRWKKRNNISFKTVYRELKSVTPEMVNV